MSNYQPVWGRKINRKLSSKHLSFYSCEKEKVYVFFHRQLLRVQEVTECSAAVTSSYYDTQAFFIQSSSSADSSKLVLAKKLFGVPQPGSHVITSSNI